MKNPIFILFILLFVRLDSFAQNKKAGGPCEGCEAIYESPVQFEKLDMFVRMPDVKDNSLNRLGINGTVYKADGKTPAPDVVLYIYHTNPKGIYAKKGNEKGWAKRHGYIRGWMKTDAKGEYKFVTIRPGPYPDHSEPAHIHITIKEPDKNEYYIDEYLFSDDPLLTSERQKKLDNRGGSGILKLVDVGEGMYKGERNIYLGKNIPDYPLQK